MTKRILALLALMLWGFTVQAAAQETMRVYISEGALSGKEEQSLISLLGGAFPQADWEIAGGEETLREMVMGDRAPQLAICPPEEARPWAREGLTVPLDGCVPEIERMHYTVVDACVMDESLFMAPLRARHRQMAVSARLIREAHMDYMLSATEHPVWFPSELYQVMDALSMQDIMSFDVWKPTRENVGGIEAFVQSLYVGALISDDASVCTADNSAVKAGVTWLRDMVDAGLVGYAQDREAALERFLAGETAIFLDWTQEDAAKAGPDFEAVAMPYPASCGLPVRAFDVTGIAVFEDEEQQRELLALSAMAFLLGDERAQAIIGERAVFEDEAIWLPCLSSSDMGATIRSRFAGALVSIFEEGAEPGEELEKIAAAIDTMAK